MSRRLLLGCALALAIACGCNTIVGIHDPVDGTPSSSSGGPQPEGGTPVAGVDRFIATWTTTNATQSLTGCPDMGTLTGQKGAIAFVSGTDGHIAGVPGAAGACRIEASVNGDTATIIEGQGCTFMLDQGGTATYAYDTGSTFQLLDAAGTTATAHFVATVTIAPSGEVCQYEEMSPYTKQK